MLSKSILSVILVGLTLSANAATTPFQIEGTDLLGGEKISVAAAEKKGMVVVFLSAKCPCSNSHVTEMKSLYKDFPDFEFVAVHSNADEPAAKAYFEKIALPFRVIEDKDFALANQLKALKTPHVFVVDQEGKTLYQGGVTDSKKLERANKKYLRAALTDVHEGRAVAIAEGRTLGCEISRGEKHVW